MRSVGLGGDGCRVERYFNMSDLEKNYQPYVSSFDH
jgi:hypothetical protein